MEATTRFREWFDSMFADELRAGVFLTTVAIGAISLGYAGGSVLAGEPLADQFWLLFVFTGLCASLVALSRNDV